MINSQMFKQLVDIRRAIELVRFVVVSVNHFVNEKTNKQKKKLTSTVASPVSSTTWFTRNAVFITSEKDLFNLILGLYNFSHIIFS